MSLFPKPMNVIYSFANIHSELASIVCPEKWATYSNAVNCESVWVGYKRKYELSGQYYTDNIKVEEKMMAMAAVKISAVIEILAKNAGFL
jgi:hypothetical protein